jgi:transposase InsO family protein
MEAILMIGRERKRLVVMSQVRAGKVRLAAAAELLEVSYRQVKRLWARYQADGDRGLVHGLRGKASNRRSGSSLREQALARYADSFADYGPTLAAESLAAEGIEVAVTTLRRWLSQAGLWQRKRARKQHRRRRARKECCGELVQMDGSHHDWFEGRREWAVLMVMIDDATGRIFARFFEEENLEAALTMLRHYIARNGLPLGLYVDRAGIYRSDREPTDEEILAGKGPQTQFGRAMEQLAVKLILARSPQAKGRVERMNGTLQDRLVKALRQRGISDLKSANEFLEHEFLEPFNAKFGKLAAQSADVHRAVPPGTDLARVLAVHEERVVQNDWTVRWQNGYLQLGRASGVQPKDRVEVCVQLDGRVRLFAGGRELSYGLTRSEPAKISHPRPSGPPKSNQGQKPSAKHPWRGKRRDLVLS